MLKVMPKLERYMVEKLNFTPLARNGIMTTRVSFVVANGSKASLKLAGKSAVNKVQFSLCKLSPRCCHCRTSSSAYSWSGQNI
jgi:hypothetical protein